MKKLTSIILILFLSLLSSPSWSETFDDLVQRDGLWYKKFTDVPFTGEITGDTQGSIKHGRLEGEWFFYHDNGQLSQKGEFKNGMEEGEWVIYYNNGQLFMKGEFKNGMEEGEWVIYYDNGELESKGKYKNGKKVGKWFRYDKDGKQIF